MLKAAGWQCALCGEVSQCSLYNKKMKKVRWYRCGNCRHVFKGVGGDKDAVCPFCGHHALEEIGWKRNWKDPAAFSIWTLIAYSIGFVILTFLSYAKGHPHYASVFQLLIILNVWIIIVQIENMPKKIIKKLK